MSSQNVAEAVDPCKLMNPCDHGCPDRSSKYLGPFWFFGPDFLARKTQDHESNDSGAAVRVTMMMTMDDLE